MKVCQEATECSWNDGGKTKYYLVIFDQLQDHSEGLIQAPESCVRGSLTWWVMVITKYLVSKLFVSWDIDLAIYVDNSVFFP